MKRFSVALVLILCVLVCQSAFAFNPFEGLANPQKETVKFIEDPSYDGFSLADAFYFTPSVESCDALMMLQAYLYPEDPVSFFIEAMNYTDEQIEDIFVVYLALVEPDLAGGVPFYYMADPERFYTEQGIVLDDTSLYGIQGYFTSLYDLNDIFPYGIARTNAYDTFRRTALWLAVYCRENGQTPSFELCCQVIDMLFAMYEEEFAAAMEEEAAAQAALDAQAAAEGDAATDAAETEPAAESFEEVYEITTEVFAEPEAEAAAETSVQ